MGDHGHRGNYRGITKGFGLNTVTVSRRQPRNRALADAVAAREFGERRALRPSPAGLVLLRRRQFWFPAHALPALLRPASALGGAGMD